MTVMVMVVVVVMVMVMVMVMVTKKILLFRNLFSLPLQIGKYVDR